MPEFSDSAGAQKARVQVCHPPAAPDARQLIKDSPGLCASQLAAPLLPWAHPLDRVSRLCKVQSCCGVHNSSLVMFLRGLKLDMYGGRDGC